jgi:hypothetical protein
MERNEMFKLNSKRKADIREWTALLLIAGYSE